ncbi:serine/threonine-protein kinase [Nocardia jiangxiensis]|uniref:Serine/threonine-protein kinase n=1 Tax=Nocardia jiangxiensis TaxID=282685 RepID=A0ABW6S093_9NOCA
MEPLGPNDPRSAGRHRLLAVIGQGAMGRLLLGRAPDGRLVAVKMVHRHLARSPEFRERFRMEVQASQRVTGAYTAAVMDADPEAPEPWLASMYVPGASLQQAVEQFGPLPLGGLRLLTAGLAAALLEIHRAGMIHRDLKPANVLLGAEGPRVIDFGIARALETQTQLTSTGSLIGSPAFMSPEQAEGYELTTASDVFSVGGMLVLAASGQNPFSGASTPQTLYNVVHGRADTSAVPAVLRPVVDACLAKNPAHRPTAEQLLGAVESVSARAAWPSEVQRAIARDVAEARRWDELDGQSPEPAGRGRRRWAIAAAVVAVVVAGGAGVLALTHGRSAVPDPLAHRTLALSDDQLRLVDTCRLLDADVIGSLGQPAQPVPTNSSVCAAKVTMSDGRQSTMTVGVGVAAPAAERTADSLAGQPVLDTTAGTRSCGRAVPAGTQSKVAVEFTVSDVDGAACTAAMSGLKATLTRLVTNSPTASLSRQSVVRVDPCTAVDSSVIGAAVGSGVPAAKIDVHTCQWQGAALGVKLQTTETARLDNDPKYQQVNIGGEIQLAPHQAARLVDADGTCSTYLMVQPTTGGRGETIAAIAHPATSASSGKACGATESVIGSVLERLGYT